MISQEQLTELRRRLYQCTRLRAEEIDVHSRQKWLVDVYAPEDDPIQSILEKITWSESEGAAVGIAGGAGVGKTMQLYRLIDCLWVKHSIIGIRVDYDEYSSLSTLPDVTDFLLTIVGGLATEAMKLNLLPPDWNEGTVQSKIWDLLKRLRVEPQLSVGFVDIKASLHEDESFRRKIREHLAGQVSQLVQEVREFASQVVQGICENVGSCSGVVMIVDSTERISAPASTESEMQLALRNLFIQNGENLKFPNLHCVYLLPPWLPISDGGSLRLDTVMFPTLRTTRRDGSDEPTGLDLLEQMVRKRMPDIESLIAGADLRELCRMSGGVQRVLFLLLRELGGRARGTTALPVGREMIETTIDTVRQGYLAITIESAEALHIINSTKGVDGLNSNELMQLERYFQALVVLQLANGETWYTIHPLMRKRLDVVPRQPRF